jgi:type IV fimbrial biogenesis protein FimT
MVELMVTLAVMVILTALAVPSFRDFFDRYRLRGAIDDAISVIANARAASVKTNHDVNVAFGGTATNWCIGANAATDPTTPGEPIPAATACDCAVASQCLVQGQRLAVNQGAHAGVAVSAVSGKFTFNSRMGTVGTSGALATPASVTFTSPSGKYDVELRVTALGQSRMCVPAGKRSMMGISPCS